MHLDLSFLQIKHLLLNSKESKNRNTWMDTMMILDFKAMGKSC